MSVIPNKIPVWRDVVRIYQRPGYKGPAYGIQIILQGVCLYYKYNLK